MSRASRGGRRATPGSQAAASARDARAGPGSAPLVPGLLVLALGVAAACAPTPERRLVRLLPDLSPSLARGLVAGDDSLVHRGVRELGPGATLRLIQRMKAAVPLGDSIAFAATKRWLDAPLLRLAGALGSEFQLEGDEAEVRAFAGRPFSLARRLSAIGDSCFALVATKGMDLAEKLTHLERWLAESRALDVVIEPPSLLSYIAQVEDERGDSLGELRAYRSALAASRERGTMVFTLQLMNTLAYVYGERGRIDSMLALHERALVESRRRGFASEVGRSLRMLGFFEDSRGNLALAHDLLLEAREAALQSNTGLNGVWEYLGLVDLHARFRAWDLVGRELERAEGILRSLPPESRVGTAAASLRVRRLKARVLVAQGQVDSALARLPPLRTDIEKQGDREVLPRLLFDMGTGLLEQARREAAAGLLAEGVSIARTRSLPALEPGLVAAWAEALAGVGRLAEAERALAEFRAVAGDDEIAHRVAWLAHDRAAIRLHLGRDEPARALDAAAEAMARLERTASRLEPSAEAYFFLDEARGLTADVHGLLRGDAAAGYGFEMWTRSLAPRLGDPRPGALAEIARSGPRRGERFEARLRAFADDLAGRIARRRWRHVLYRVGTDRTLRWTCDSSGIRRDELPVGERELRGQVTRARTVLIAARERRAEGAILDTLARSLLPEIAVPRPGGQDRRLLVSRDHVLQALPFDALDLDPSAAYVPVLDEAEVAYLRCCGPEPRHHRDGSALVVADPDLPADLRRRYPSLASIPRSATEAREVARRRPGATLLVGPRATKADITRRWEGVSTFHVAAHFIRDPDLPYSTFLPLARPAGSTDRQDGYLDLEDVRGASFRRCGLVVLSGCQTGAPYESPGSIGPSLGDAFVDAGAGAVIDTSWPVRDQEAQRLMRGFLEASDRGASPIQALRAARQAARLAQGRGEAEGVWAAYSITLGAPPD